MGNIIHKWTSLIRNSLYEELTIQEMMRKGHTNQDEQLQNSARYIYLAKTTVNNTTSKVFSACAISTSINFGAPIYHYDIYTHCDIIFATNINITTARLTCSWQRISKHSGPCSPSMPFFGSILLYTYSCTLRTVRMSCAERRSELEGREDEDGERCEYIRVHGISCV